MSETEAEDYHRAQIETFAGTAADLVTAITMNYVEEAVGVARAAQRANMPVVISFTVETDGRLPTGQSLGDAIEQVDDATSGYPAYYMINCAHPSHFDQVVGGDAPWLERIRGLRANASRMSHAELNEAPELDAGIPPDLGQEYAGLRRRQLKHLNVMGGCCGTDHRHIEHIASACLPLFREARHAPVGPMSVVYRKAVSHDIAACIDLRGKTRENAVSVERLKAAGITLDTWSSDVADDTLPGYVCLSGDRIVGYCFGFKDTGEIAVVALLPEFEDRGIGRTLLDKMVRDFRNLGFDRLFLGCSSDPKTRSYGFYRHLGWRSTGTFDAANDEVLEYFP